MWGKGVPGRGKSKCKGPGVGVQWKGQHKVREGRVAGPSYWVRSVT